MGCEHEKLEADVAILGSGPAGLALAGSCAARGLETVVVAPSFERLWQQSYGAFATALEGWQLGGFGIGNAVRSRHARPLVLLDAEPPIALEVPYLRLDTSRLQFGLLDAVKALGVRLVSGTVHRVARDEGARAAVVSVQCDAMVEGARGAAASASTVVERDEFTVAARYVFDATGSTSRFTTRTRSEPIGFQTAYGRWLMVDTLPCDLDTMFLMDYRASEPEDPPSFLYALPEAEHRLFVQETVLASRNVVSMQSLSERLDRRLRRLGLQVQRTLGEERCVIPLGVGLPIPAGDVFPFGAAAGFVNPVSGYQLGRAFRVASRVARAAAEGGDAPTIHGALWEKSERDAYRIYHAALDQMLRIGPREHLRFISNFFALPTTLWLGFMMGEQQPSEVATTMWRLFSRAPNALRLELVRAAAGYGKSALASFVKEVSP